MHAAGFPKSFWFLSIAGSLKQNTHFWFSYELLVFCKLLEALSKMHTFGFLLQSWFFVMGAILQDALSEMRHFGFLSH